MTEGRTREHPAAGRRTLSGGVTLATIGNVTPPIAALITAPVLARTLDAAGRGDVAAAVAPLTLLASGFTLGIPEAVTYFVARRTSAPRSVLRSGVLISIALGVIGATATWFAAPVLSDQNAALASLMRIASVGLIPALAIGAIRGYARGQHRWGLVALDQVISALLRLLAVVALALSGSLNLTTAAAVLAVCTFVGGLAYVPLAFGPRTPASVPTAVIRPLMSFGLGTWLGAVAGVLLSRFDQAIFLLYSSSAQLGIYAVGVSLSDVVRVFNSSVRDVVFATQSGEVNWKQATAASRLSTIVTVIGAVIIGVGSLFAVPILFGVGFEGAVIVICILLIGTVLGNPGSVMAAAMAASGSPVLRSLSIIVGLVVNMALLAAWAPAGGAVGAAWAASVGNAATGAMIVLLAWLRFQQPPSESLLWRRSDFERLRDVVARRLRRERRA